MEKKGAAAKKSTPSQSLTVDTVKSGAGKKVSDGRAENKLLKVESAMFSRRACPYSRLVFSVEILLACPTSLTEGQINLTSRHSVFLSIS